MEVSENVTGGLLEICTALESGGTLETDLIITLVATDDIAGEIFVKLLGKIVSIEVCPTTVSCSKLEHGTVNLSRRQSILGTCKAQVIQRMFVCMGVKLPSLHCKQCVYIHSSVHIRLWYSKYAEKEFLD